MAQSLPKSQLHDIPLSVVDHGDTLREGDKLHSKSNSLRRFFKMPHKKGGGSEQIPDSPSELQLETADYDEADQETGLERKKVQSGGLQRRFHLRLGSMNKYANDAAMDASDKSNGPGVSGSNSSSGGSSAGGKPTLKGSISSYWNTVFKRHHLSHSKGDASIPPEEFPKELDQLEAQQSNEKGDPEKEHNDSGNDDEERGEEENEGDDDDDDDDELNNERELLEEVHTLPFSEDIPL